MITKWRTKSNAEEQEQNEDSYEDNEETEEEDEGENDSREGNNRRKERKHYSKGFIIDEAEVDDEVEEEDEWEDGAEEIGIIQNEYEEERGPTAREIEGHRRVTSIWNSQREDQIEEYLKKKYASEVNPKNTVLQLMRKYIAHQSSNEPLKIKSVIAPSYVKGYIYVEAFKQPFVKQAIMNIGSLRSGLWEQQMVPIKEMTDVLRVVKEQSGLKARQWVRLQRGLYKDDIAQVDYVDLTQNQNTETRRKVKRRPPPKLFDPESIRGIGGEITSDGDFLIFEGNRYSRKGFLYKNFAMSAVLVDELERFEESLESVNIEIPCEDTKVKDKTTTHCLSTGDNVYVCEGELMSLQGKILTIDGSLVTVMPKHKDLTVPLEFQANELKKYFKQGDHVKVISGRYEGDTGLILRVEENRVVLFSDLSMHELEILPKDIQLCSDMASGVDAQGQFQWGDMVQIDPQTVGVIVRLEREMFHVLNMFGKVLQMKPQALQKKKDSHFTIALDSEQNAIQRKDIVRVVDGPHDAAFSPGLGYSTPRITSPSRSQKLNEMYGGKGRGVRRDQELIGQTIKITVGPYKDMAPVYALTPSPLGYIPSPDTLTQYGTPSPVLYSPLSQGTAPSLYFSQTPVPGFDQFTIPQQEWHTTDIEVRIRFTHDDGGLIGQIGVIRGISGNMASIFLPDEDRVVNILLEHLEPVVPKRLDIVKVIFGDDREAVGQLLSIDIQEGVVKFNSGEVKLLPLKFLCRMQESKENAM
ncbi:Transcription elongation factor SPT5 [Blattella germanica]|nr:Transcription elongation factor SPT5 [Blattella germanica]